MMIPDSLKSLFDANVLNEREREKWPERFENVTYCGRTFAGRVTLGYGNPIKLREETEEARVECLLEYWDWLQSDHIHAVGMRRRIRNGELDGVLSCWCQPKMCHAWILTALANGRATELKEWLETLR